MPFLHHDGITFHYLDSGEGVPFLFQHGLGGDVTQSYGLLTPPLPFRLLSFDFRGHGETRPLGDSEKLSFATFADDLLAVLDERHIAQAVIGGISMGAAVALNFALRYPQRMLGLVLVRPAWLNEPLPANLQAYPRIAQLIRQHGVAQGRELFMQTEEYREALSRSLYSATSLLNQFTRPRAEETMALLERLPNDAPNSLQEEWVTIRVPTLILACQHDPIHPFAYGELLARSIRGALFKEVTAKAINEHQHALDVQVALETFLLTSFQPGTEE